jgi:hypothetical protein
MCGSDIDIVGRDQPPTEPNIVTLKYNEKFSTSDCCTIQIAVIMASCAALILISFEEISTLQPNGHPKL